MKLVRRGDPFDCYRFFLIAAITTDSGAELKIDLSHVNTALILMAHPNRPRFSGYNALLLGEIWQRFPKRKNAPVILFVVYSVVNALGPGMQFLVAYRIFSGFLNWEYVK